MAKTLYRSSRPAKRIRVKAVDIFSEALSKRQTALIGRLKTTADADIDYSDIPPLTDEQLDEMVRRFYRQPKQLVSVRPEPKVLRGVMQQARSRKVR
jgi:hypothetical protein